MGEAHPSRQQKRPLGHARPQVSGVLPVALEKATKCLPLLLKSDKEYIGIMKLHRQATDEEIEKTFRQFTGKIEQLPPVKSAVRRKVRTRTINSLVILERSGRDVLFKVECEAGTYVRKLVHDIGMRLGGGAHMTELRRTAVSGIRGDKAVKLQDLSDAFWLWKEKCDDSLLRKYLLPPEAAIFFRKIYVSDYAVESICSGGQLALPGVVRLDEGIRKGEKVALMTMKDELVAIAEALLSSEEIMENARGIATKTIRVIMEKGAYPRWQGRHVGGAEGGSGRLKNLSG